MVSLSAAKLVERCAKMEKKKPAKKKPIGYTASDRKSMKQLIERTQPNVGDYVGSGTVTVKKPAKKMAAGGFVGPKKTGLRGPTGPEGEFKYGPFSQGLRGQRKAGTRGPTGPKQEMRSSSVKKATGGKGMRGR